MVSHRTSLSSFQSIGERTYWAIRNAILENRLKTGERLIESEIANELGVSRVPVREAFHKLELEGFIERISKKKFAVAILSKNRIEDIFDVRCVLETYAVEHSLNRISDDDIEEMEQCLNEGESAINNGEMLEFRSALIKFHEIITKACGNEMLTDLLRLLIDLVFPYSSAKVGTIQERLKVIEGDRMILTAIRSRDKAATIEALKIYHSESKDRIIARYRGRIFTFREVEKDSNRN